jgi:DNA polymerase I-like protein with 3'-5' exonuclease and polymerase domains
MSLFLDEPDWVRPDQWPRLKGVTALDFETVDPELKKRGASWAFPGVGKVVGIGVSGPSITAYYPVAHEYNNVDADKTWAWLKHELENPDPSLQLIVFNWTYEMGWLRRYGIRPKCPVFDPGVGAALLDEARLSYSLNAIAQTYLKEEKTSGDLMSFADALGVSDVWSNMDRMPAQYVGPYCEQDCALTLKLHTEIMTQINRLDLNRVHRLEHEILPVVLDMRWDGVPVNIDRVERRLSE